MVSLTFLLTAALANTVLAKLKYEHPGTEEIEITPHDRHPWKFSMDCRKACRHDDMYNQAVCEKVCYGAEKDSSETMNEEQVRAYVKILDPYQPWDSYNYDDIRFYLGAWYKRKIRINGVFIQHIEAPSEQQLKEWNPSTYSGPGCAMFEDNKWVVHRGKCMDTSRQTEYWPTEDAPVISPGHEPDDEEE